ncbi:hypothetical protein DM860_014724 [Cuscuta australis]|uniref:Pentacotripeptide-repeat region of PRORP domain-containing protein n=1 Tax=Cuscuta australis TaxID=267555 RepID=A0A328DIF9_9ASTE|nr:hypothetical protein DM860_014724 [Cuscuta australis]
MRKKGVYKFSSSDYAVQFNLIYKVRGCSASERYVRNLPKQARNCKTCREILHCSVHENIGTWKSPLWHLQKMKELGFALSPLLFNETMHICAESYQINEIPWVMAEMKKSKVLPDNDSYRMCISSLGIKGDLDGVEIMLREMESQPHIVMDWCTYAMVAELYDREFLLDKATDALEKARVILQKDIRRKRPNYLLDYGDVIKSLVKLGELDEAVKFMTEWEASGNWCNLDGIGIPYTIIEEYVKNGKLREAFNKIEVWGRKGKPGVDKLSSLLCKEYLKVGNVIQAFNCFWVTGNDFEVHLVVPMLFFKYLEEECGSFFPLRCTRSVQPATAGAMFLEVNPTTHMVDYENIKSLVESGRLNDARKMVIEWERCDNRRTSADHLNILKLIIEGYCKKCFFMEAEAIAEAWTREKRSQVAEIWFVLASHYQLHGKMVRGFECMRRCFDLTPGLNGNYRTMFRTFINVIEYSRGYYWNSSRLVCSR